MTPWPSHVSLDCPRSQTGHSPRSRCRHQVSTSPLLPSLMLHLLLVGLVLPPVAIARHPAPGGSVRHCGGIGFVSLKTFFCLFYFTENIMQFFAAGKCAFVLLRIYAIINVHPFHQCLTPGGTTI